MTRILSLVFAGSFLILSVAHCTLARDRQGGGMEILSRQCREENKLTPEEAEDLRPMNRVDTTDQNAKCYVKCMLTGMNLMNEEGDITLDDLSGHLKKHQNHFQPCRNVTGTDLCDKAVNFHNCVWQQKNQRHT